MSVLTGVLVRLPLLIFLFAIFLARPVWAQSEELTRNYQRGSSLFEAGMYKASTSYFVKALELSESEYGRDSSRTAQGRRCRRAGAGSEAVAGRGAPAPRPAAGAGAGATSAGGSRAREANPPRVSVAASPSIREV